MIISGGDQAPEIAASLKRILAPMASDFGLSVDEKFDHFRLPLPPKAPPVVLHRHGDYFILALGQETLAAVTAALDGKSNGLAKSERFQKGLERVLMPRTGSVAWFDIQRMQQMTELLPAPQLAIVQQVLKLSGLESLDHVASANGLADGLVRSRTFIANGGRSDGIWTLAAGRPIQAEDLKSVPVDADLVVAFSLNLGKLLAEAKRIAGIVNPRFVQQIEGVLAEVNEDIGLNVEEDLLPAFGDVWVLYDAPSTGGLVVTGAVLSLEVRDAEKARQAYDKLIELARSSLPPDRSNTYHIRKIELAERKFQRYTVHYVNTIGDDDVPVAPAFCLTDTHLLATLHPQAMKAHLRTVNKKTSFASKLGDQMPWPEGDVLCASFVDLPRWARLLYSAVPFIGQIAASELQSEGIAIDGFSIPSARAVIPYLQPQTSTVTRTAEGILCENSSTLLLSPAAAVLPVVALMTAQQEIGARVVRERMMEAEMMQKEAVRRHEEAVREREEAIRQQKEEPAQPGR